MENYIPACRRVFPKFLIAFLLTALIITVGLGRSLTTAVTLDPDTELTAWSPATTHNPPSGAWMSRGPYGGSVRSLTVAPNDGEIVYAGTYGSGIYRSNDAGTTWTFSGTGMGELDRINVVVTVPGNGNIIYAGTHGDGIYKSVDGGATWTQINNGLLCATTWPEPGESCSVVDLAVDPSNSLTVFAVDGYSDGLFKTVDGGETWTQVFPEKTLAVAIDPNNSKIVYIGTDALGVQKSNDGGASWEAKNQGLVSPETSGLDISDIAVHSGDSQVVLVAANYYGSTNPVPTGVYRTTNGGDSWNPTSLTGNYWAYRYANIVFDPLVPTTLYVNQPYLYRSTDGGATWTLVSYQTPHELALSSTDSDIIYGAMSSDGVYKSVDQGASWSRSTEGILNVDVHDIGIDPGNEQTLYATSPAGIWRSVDGGGSWSKILDSISAVGAVAVSPDDSSTIYAGKYKSIDGGSTWHQMDIRALDFAFDPSDSRVIYSSSGQLWKSTDAGATWTNILAAQSSWVAVDPGNENVVYTGGGDGDGVYKSVDGGATWTSYTTGFQHAEVLALTISPENSQRLIAATTSGVSTSNDGGVSWTSEYTDIGYVQEFAVNPINSDHVYAAVTGVYRWGEGSFPGGIYVSYDGGSHWQRMEEEGLPMDPSKNLQVQTIAANSAVLYVGTPRNSIWQTSIADSDGDGLLDDWEINGYDHDDDGTVDVDLPTMGADPNIPDIFVEIDYMWSFDEEGNSVGHSHRPKPAAIKKVVDAFAEQGIHLHVDWGPLAELRWGDGSIWDSLSDGQIISHRTDLNSEFAAWDNWRVWPGFDEIKITRGYFKPERVPIFHYAIIAHNPGGTINGEPADFKGLSRNNIFRGWEVYRNGGISDFVVTLGKEGTETEQAVSFMHELGHNLGLHHGGDNDTNHKPNYLSVMNTSFRNGLIKEDESGHLDYSQFDESEIPQLDEEHLDETVGLNGVSAADIYGTRWYCQNILGEWNVERTDQANEPINWDCLLGAGGEDVQADINRSGNDADELTTYDDWSNLVYDAGTIGINTPSIAPATYTGSDDEPEPIVWDENFPDIPEPYAVSIGNSAEFMVSSDFSLTIPVTLTNKGYLTATITFSHTVGSDWFDLSSVPLSATLAPSATVSYDVSLSIPASTVTGSEQEVTLEAFLNESPLMSDVVILQARVGPMAWFEAEPVAGTAPHTVQFRDISVGQYTSRLWDFGDGAQSTGPNPNHVYTSPGVYTVSLTVTGADGTDVYTRENLIRVRTNRLYLPAIQK